MKDKTQLKKDESMQQLDAWIEKKLQNSRKLIALNKEALKEFRRIYPSELDSAAVRFISTLVLGISHSFKKLSESSVTKRFLSGTSESDVFVEKTLPYSFAELANEVNTRFSEHGARVKDLAKAKADVDRFVSICDLLVELIGLSAEKGDGLCITSDPFWDCIKLLSDPLCRESVDRSFSADEQKRMTAAICSVGNALMALLSTTGLPSVNEIPQSFLSAFTNPSSKAKGCSSLIFDYDKERAYYTPRFFVEIVSFSQIVREPYHKALKNMSDASFSFLKDEFDEEILYEVILALLGRLAQTSGSAIEYKRVLKKVDARFKLITIFVHGGFPNAWRKLMGEIENLQQKLSTCVSDSCRTTLVNSLKTALRRRQSITDLLGIADFKIDDYIRGFVPNAHGDLVQIKEFPCPDAANSTLENCPAIPHVGAPKSSRGKHKYEVSERKGENIAERIHVSPEGDVLTFVTAKGEYDLTTHSKEFWNVVDKLFEMYLAALRPLKTKKEKLAKALELAKQPGPRFDTGRAIRNSTGSLFKRACRPPTNKETLFSFKIDDADTTATCHINFRADLFK